MMKITIFFLFIVFLLPSCLNKKAINTNNIKYDTTLIINDALVETFLNSFSLKAMSYKNYILNKRKYDSSHQNDTDMVYSFTKNQDTIDFFKGYNTFPLKIYITSNSVTIMSQKIRIGMKKDIFLTLSNINVTSKNLIEISSSDYTTAIYFYFNSDTLEKIHYDADMSFD